MIILNNAYLGRRVTSTMRNTSFAVVNHVFIPNILTMSNLIMTLVELHSVVMTRILKLEELTLISVLYSGEEIKVISKIAIQSFFNSCLKLLEISLETNLADILHFVILCYLNTEG